MLPVLPRLTSNSYLFIFLAVLGLELRASRLLGFGLSLEPLQQPCFLLGFF
jgi:hypothetical protein